LHLAGEQIAPTANVLFLATAFEAQHATTGAQRREGKEWSPDLLALFESDDHELQERDSRP